jgi:hypothetical protein
MIIVNILALSACSSTTANSQSLFDFEITIDGKSYTLPQNINAFTDNGWSFPESFKNLDKTLSPGNLEQTYLEKDEDNWFSVEIFNYTKEDCTVKDCPIGRIIYNFSGNMEIYTAGNFLLNGKTLDDVLKKYGEPYSNTKLGNYIEVIYDKNPEESIFDRYVFMFDPNTEIINGIDITYFG